MEIRRFSCCRRESHRIICDSIVTMSESDSLHYAFAIIIASAKGDSGVCMTARRGLYRCTIPGLAECARTHASAGDASPFLDRETYEALAFEPPFPSLPTREDYLGSSPGTRFPIRACDQMWTGTSA